MDQHGIAVAVEPIAFPDRLAVGVENGLTAGEGRDEEEQRRLGEVEIRDYGVNGLELVAGPDHQTGLARARHQPIGLDRTFQRSYGGGADRYDAMTTRSRGGVGLRGVVRDEVWLRRDAMVGNVLGVYARESSRTDMKQDLVNANPPSPEPGQEGLGEVQACGGRGDAAGLFREDGLVSISIQGPIGAIDIGGKRQMAQPLEELQEVGAALKSHRASAVRMDRDDSAGFDVSQPDHSPDLKLPARANEGAELSVVFRLRKQIEDLGAPSTPGRAQEAGRQNPAPVDHQQVSGSEKIGQGEETRVRQSPGDPVEDQKPRRVPILKRDLRDAVRRQVEIEFPGLQNSFFCGRPAPSRSRPKCRYAWAVAIRPRGVRSMKPI